MRERPGYGHLLYAADWLLRNDEVLPFDYLLMYSVTHVFLRSEESSAAELDASCTSIHPKSVQDAIQPRIKSSAADVPNMHG